MKNAQFLESSSGVAPFTVSPSKELPRRQQIDEHEHQKWTKLQQNCALIVDKGSLEKY